MNFVDDDDDEKIKRPGENSVSALIHETSERN